MSDDDEQERTTFSTLAVVIPTMHRVDHVLELVRQVRTTSPIPATFTIVDNGPEASEAGWEALDGHVVIRERYLGSEQGFVLGLRSAPSADWYLLLDHDANIDERCLPTLFAAVTDDSSVYSANVRGDSSSPCMRQWVPRPAALLVRDPTAPAVPIDLAPWSGLLLPQNAAEVVKLQDSGYFFGWDDYLACFRLRCAGFQIEAVPAAVIGNERASGDDWLAPWRAYYLTRNRVLFLLETRWVSWPAVLLVEGRNFRRAVAACRLKRAAAIARGMFDGLMNRRGPRMMPS